MRHKSKQGTRLISARYRLSFAARFVCIACIGFALFAVFLFLMLNRRLGIGYLHDLTTLSALQERLPLVIVGLGITQAVVVGSALFILSLIWAHAVSGPLVRVRKYSNMLSEGSVIGDVRFRLTDQLHILAGAFGRLNIAANKRRDAFKNLLTEAQQLLQESQRLRSKEDSSKLNETLASLKDTYEKMHRLILRGELG